MNTKLGKILAEISAGELIDKITILEFKKSKITKEDKLAEIEKELVSLNSTLKKSIPENSKIIKYNIYCITFLPWTLFNKWIVFFFL